MSTRPLSLLPLVLAAALVPVGDASATTAGGYLTRSIGPVTVAGPHPVFATSVAAQQDFTTGEYAYTGLASSTPTRELDIATLPGVAARSRVLPLVASDGHIAAVGWRTEAGVYTTARRRADGRAVLDTRAHELPATAVPALGVAPDGGRGLAWNAPSGVMLEQVAGDGSVVPPVAVAPPGTAAGLQLAYDAAGDAWVVFDRGGRSQVVRVHNGTPGPLTDLGPRTDPAAQELHPARLGGGIWIRRGRELARVDGDRVVTRVMLKHTSSRVAADRDQLVVVSPAKGRRNRADIFVSRLGRDGRVQSRHNLTASPRQGERLLDIAVEDPSGVVRVLYSRYAEEQPRMRGLARTGRQTGWMTAPDAIEFAGAGDGNVVVTLGEEVYEEEENEDGGGSSAESYSYVHLYRYTAGVPSGRRSVLVGTNTY